MNKSHKLTGVPMALTLMGLLAFCIVWWVGFVDVVCWMMGKI